MDVAGRNRAQLPDGIVPLECDDEEKNEVVGCPTVRSILAVRTGARQQLATVCLRGRLSAMVVVLTVMPFWASAQLGRPAILELPCLSCLFSDEEFTKLLELTPPQNQRLEGLLAEHVAPLWRARDWKPLDDKSQRLITSINDSLIRSLDDVLLDRQRTTLAKLWLRVRGPRALLSPELTQEFALEDAQINRLQEIATKTDHAIETIKRRVGNDLATDFRFGPAQLREQENQDLLRVLSVAQLREWNQRMGVGPRPRLSPALGLVVPRLAKSMDWVSSEAVELETLKGNAVVIAFLSADGVETRSYFELISNWHREFASRSFGSVLIFDGPNEESIAIRAAAGDAMKLAIDRRSESFSNWSIPKAPALFLLDKSGLARWWWQGRLTQQAPKDLHDRLATLLAEQQLVLRR